MDDRETMTDAQLLRAWQNDDKVAGKVLYQRHFNAVDRFFRNKVCDPEDLIQRTFAACLAKPHKYEERSKFRTYLLGIGYRLLLKHYRNKARIDDHAALGLRSAAQMDPTPSELLARRDEHRKLLEALRRLPLHLQVTIELRFWEDLKVREIAQLLDQPEGTTKEWIRRSKVLLERSMAEFDASGQVLRTTTTRLEDWAARARLCMEEGDESGANV